MDCEQVYIGETGRTMQKRVTEHKTAVWKYDKNNGIAVHAWRADHRIDWEAARVRATNGRRVGTWLGVENLSFSPSRGGHS